ncbi:MAG: MDR family MFS transporter [Slackia sp.]|nr:MDR family MFS transporter [Slackia sp.]
MKLTRKQVAMLAILIAGTFITVLNQTLVTPALPSIMAEMAVDAATAQWLTTGFTLVNAIMIPVTAYLTDRYSTRGLFVASMLVFAAGSALAGWGPDFAILLIGRLLQAAGAGILMPMVMTVIMLTFPPDKRGFASGLFGIVIAFAPAFGPSAAGFVIDAYGWHVLFWAIVVLALAITIASLFALERSPKESADVTLDKVSLVQSSIGFGSLLYGLSSIGSFGLNPLDGAATLVGIVVLVFFFRRQLRLERPMLDVRVLKNRKFLVGTVIAMLVQGSLLAAGILMPIYLQSYLGYSATVSGLVLMPGAILMGIMGPIAGRLFDRHGPRTLSLVGMGLLAASTLVFAFLGDDTGLAFLIGLYTVRMFAIALVNMPITTWAMNALDNRVLNHGTSVNNTLRQVAGSLGTAVLISLSTAASSAASSNTDALHAGIFGVDAAFFASALLCFAGFAMTVAWVKDKPGDAAAADPDDINRTVLERVMKRDVYTLPETATVLDAVALFVDKHISAAPIVNETGAAVGFVSDGDLARCLSKRRSTYTDPVAFIELTEASSDDFAEKTEKIMGACVLEIAHRGVISVDIHTDIREVCRVLGNNHLKKVPVTDKDAIVGVVNLSDIARFSMASYLERHRA